MTLMDYCMQYIGEIMDGKRAAPEGVTLTETDPMRRSLELMQKDRKSTRLNSSHSRASRMPSSA